MFVKGKSGNPRGRTPGAQTKKTKQWIALQESIVGMGAERFNKYLHECNDKEFITAYLQILKYFKPKLARTEIKEDNETTITVVYEPSD